jgi:hypothetical protein
MDWLTDALREPLVEVVNLVGLVFLAAVTRRLRKRQRRAHDVLRADGALPPLDSRPSSSVSSMLQGSQSPRSGPPDLEL